MSDRDTLLASIWWHLCEGGMIRSGFLSSRPWVFTRRYYSPRGWRCPRFIWMRCWRYDVSGKSASIQLSYLHEMTRSARERGH